MGIAQSSGPGVRLVKEGPRTDELNANARGADCVFYVQGKAYRSVLTSSQVKSAQSWTPSAPLPYNLGRAEKKARIELKRFVNDADRWIVSDFRVARLRFVDENAWFMSVSFEPAEVVFIDGMPLDSFTVLLDFDGKPGQISSIDREKKQGP